MKRNSFPNPSVNTSKFFLNSGTLKGSSRLFKESQGVPPSVADPGRTVRGRCAVFHAHLKKPFKTNEKSTFLVLVLPKSFEKRARGYPIARSDGVLPSPSIFKSFQSPLGPIWSPLGPIWSAFGFI